MSTQNKQPETAGSKPELSPNYYIGTRVKLIRDVERFPHFIARKGLTGTINHWSEDDASVKMDEPLKGAEEWDNCILWSAINQESLFDDVDAI